MTKQPVWKYVGTIGDVHPIQHGGGFVYADLTEVYPPELEYIEVSDDGNTVVIHRIVLEPCRFKTFLNFPGTTPQLADPSQRGKTWQWANEWWVEKLDDMCRSNDISKFFLLRRMLSSCPMERAWAYSELISYYGAMQFNYDPKQLTETEAIERYNTLNSPDIVTNWIKARLCE